MSNAIKSLGTKLYKLKQGEEQEDLLLAKLTNIGEIKIETDDIDVTTLDSTGGYKEYIPGFKDAGEVSIEGVITEDSPMETLLGLVSSQKTVNWEIVPNGVTKGEGWKFSGYIKSFGESEASTDGVRKFTASIRISGEPTFGTL